MHLMSDDFNVFFLNAKTHLADDFNVSDVKFVLTT